jgi:Mn2+/Fe2+ NRAMP family transporter
MIFDTCDNADIVLGFSLFVLSFFLAIFTIDSYNNLSEEDKKHRHLQMIVAWITIALISVYVLYTIKDPVRKMIKRVL